MDARVFNMGTFDVQPSLKCKGTFVGHQVNLLLLALHSTEAILCIFMLNGSV